MKHYICSYNDNSTPAGESEVFLCQADNEEHAREQCENAYPSAFIAEVYEDEREHLPTKADYRDSAIARLETLAEDILSEIDGGEELRGRDSQLSAWAADIENAVQILKQTF